MKIHELFAKCVEIHDKKSRDYTSGNTTKFENFERAGMVASWFEDKIDKSFATLIGVKLARMASLMQFGKTPNFESLEDTFIDLVTYSALWAEYRCPSKEYETLYTLDKKAESILDRSMRLSLQIKEQGEWKPSNKVKRQLAISEEVHSLSEENLSKVLSLVRQLNSHEQQ